MTDLGLLIDAFRAARTRNGDRFTLVRERRTGDVYTFDDLAELLADALGVKPRVTRGESGGDRYVKVARGDVDTVVRLLLAKGYEVGVAIC